MIEFPKDQSVRKRMQDKAQEQKSVLVLSIASVLIVSVFLNQWLVQGPDASLSANGSRNVASFDASSFAKDVKWEQDLAKRLASDNSITNGKIAEDPTLRDEMIFGYFEGKYGMKLSKGRIETLEFIDSQAGEYPKLITDKAEFLVKYSDAFGRKFDEVHLVPASDGQKVYKLLNSKKEIVGQAAFAVDDQGRVQTIQFSQ